MSYKFIQFVIIKIQILKKNMFFIASFLWDEFVILKSNIIQNTKNKNYQAREENKDGEVETT